MKFTISKKEFYNAVSVTGHAVSPNSPSPYLRGIMIEAVPDSLIITGSNDDLSIRTTITSNEENMLTVYEEGSILIENRYLSEIVKKLDSDTISVEIIDGSLTKFQGLSAVYKINGMNVQDYPIIDFHNPVTTFNMDVELLREVISQTAFATATKDTKPVLMGINFNQNNDKLVCTATDSYRLSKKIIDFPSEDSFNITIPTKTLTEVNSTMLNNSGEIKVYLDDKKVQFVSDNMVLQSKLLDGAFPDTDRMIPDSFRYVMTINRMDLINAIDRTTFIKNDNIAINRLQCSVDEIVLTNKSQEIGESHENLVAQYEGEPLDISFSGLYVMDASKVLRSDEITLSFNGEMKPFIIKDANDDSVVEIVLPVRTYH